MPPTKMKPAIYNGSFGWGWVSLSELAEMLDLDPVEVWSNFSVAAKPDGDGKPTLYWTTDGEKAQVAGMEEASKGSKKLFVPAGWALYVLKLWEKGALSVREEPHRHVSEGTFCPLAADYRLHPCRLDTDRGEGHFIAPIAIGKEGYPVRV